MRRRPRPTFWARLSAGVTTTVGSVATLLASHITSVDRSRTWSPLRRLWPTTHDRHRRSAALRYRFSTILLQQQYCSHWVPLFTVPAADMAQALRLSGQALPGLAVAAADTRPSRAAGCLETETAY